MTKVAQTPEKKKPVRAKTATNPTRGDIEARAYELYLARAGGNGSETDDWCKAEVELRGGSKAK